MPEDQFLTTRPHKSGSISLMALVTSNLTYPHKKKSNGVKSHDVGSQLAETRGNHAVEFVAQKIRCCMRSVTHSAVLLESYVVEIYIFQFRPQKMVIIK